MTLNLSEQEMNVLQSIADKKGISKTSAMRQALRTYQAIDERISQGARIWFENDKAIRSELLWLHPNNSKIESKEGG